VSRLTIILTAWDFKKTFFSKTENKPWMVEAKCFLKIKNASQKILRNFLVSEVFIENVIFGMLLMII
jgi:hypothetical protein